MDARGLQNPIPGLLHVCSSGSTSTESRGSPRSCTMCRFGNSALWLCCQIKPIRLQLLCRTLLHIASVEADRVSPWGRRRWPPNAVSQFHLPIVVPFSSGHSAYFPTHEDLIDWESVPRAVIGLVHCLAVRKSKRAFHPSIPWDEAEKAQPFHILSDQQTCLHKCVRENEPGNELSTAAD